MHLLLDLLHLSQAVYDVMTRENVYHQRLRRTSRRPLRRAASGDSALLTCFLVAERFLVRVIVFLRRFRSG